MKFGLANIARAVRGARPSRTRLPSIIVAGTNGKGSVTAMIDAALRAAGHRAARYTSPHLVAARGALRHRRTARSRPTRSRDAAAPCAGAVERLTASGALLTHRRPSSKCTTAVAFELFRRAGVDIAVLEVGLGGRLDADEHRDAARRRDHVDRLRSPGAAREHHRGDRGREGGRHQAGDAGGLRPAQPEAVAVIERVCAERGARLVRADEGVDADVVTRRRVTTLRLTTRRAGVRWTRLALRGASGRQRGGRAAAAGSIDARGLAVGPIGDRARRSPRRRGRRGCERVRHADGREMLLDAAHNPAGARALAAYLQEACPTARRWCSARCATRTSREMLAALAPRARRRSSCTQPPHAAAPRPRRISPRCARDRARRSDAMRSRTLAARVDRAWARRTRIVVLPGRSSWSGAVLARPRMALTAVPCCRCRTLGHVIFFADFSASPICRRAPSNDSFRATPPVQLHPRGRPPSPARSRFPASTRSGAGPSAGQASTGTSRGAVELQRAGHRLLRRRGEGRHRAQSADRRSATSSFVSGNEPHRRRAG